MKKLLQSRSSRWILIGIALLMIWGLVSLGTYIAWIHGADHRDFYPRWAGARMVLEGEKEIYSIEATTAIQIRLYGAEIPEGRDQQGFAYPAIVLPFLIPFALIDDVEVATSIWEGLTVVLIIIGLYLLQKTSRRDVSLLPILLLVLWSYTLLMIFQGQITGLVLSALSIGAWAYYRRADFIGGLILSIGFVKPELVILPIATLVAFAIMRRRFRLVIGILMGFSALFLASLLFMGWWVGDWLEALARYTDYARTVWPIGYLGSSSPLLIIGLSVLVIWGVPRIWKDDEAILAASVPLQILLFPQTLIWGLTMLCFPLTFAWNRNACRGVLGIWVLGWLLLLGNVNSEWWKVQIVIVSVATLLLIFISAGWKKDETDLLKVP